MWHVVSVFTSQHSPAVTHLLLLPSRHPPHTVLRAVRSRLADAFDPRRAAAPRFRPSARLSLPLSLFARPAAARARLALARRRGRHRSRPFFRVRRFRVQRICTPVPAGGAWPL